MRSIDATDEADRLTGMAGEALLRSGRPANVAEPLTPRLAGMDPESPGRAAAARVLAAALDGVGRPGEAAALRTSTAWTSDRSTCRDGGRN